MTDAKVVDWISRSVTDTNTKRVLRGVILKLVYQKHERQETRFSGASLLLALDGLGHHVYENLVNELVQDLGDRGYLIYAQAKNRKTGEVSISQIQLTANGRDLVEGIGKNPAVDL